MPDARGFAFHEDKTREYHGGGTPDVGGRCWKGLEGRLGNLGCITTTGARAQIRGG